MDVLRKPKLALRNMGSQPRSCRRGRTDLAPAWGLRAKAHVHARHDPVTGMEGKARTMLARVQGVCKP